MFMAQIPKGDTAFEGAATRMEQAMKSKEPRPAQK